MTDQRNGVFVPVLESCSEARVVFIGGGFSLQTNSNPG